MGRKHGNFWNPLFFIERPESTELPAEFKQEGHTLDEIEGACEFDSSLLEM